MTHQINSIVIDTENNTVFPASTDMRLESSELIFHSVDELAKSSISIKKMSEIVAKELNVEPRRFATKQKGAERIYTVVNDLYDEGFEEEDTELNAPDEGEAEVNTESEVVQETKPSNRRKTGLIVEPKAANEVTQARAGTKQQKLLEMLSRGVTEAEAIAELNCNASEFRRKLSGASVKDHGYGVYFDGETYTIVLPEGLNDILDPR